MKRINTFSTSNKKESKEHDGMYVFQMFNFKYLLEFVSVGNSCFEINTGSSNWQKFYDSIYPKIWESEPLEVSTYIQLHISTLEVVRESEKDLATDHKGAKTWCYTQTSCIFKKWRCFQFYTSKSFKAHST